MEVLLAGNGPSLWKNRLPTLMSSAATCGNHSGTKPNTIPGQNRKVFGVRPEPRSTSPGISASHPSCYINSVSWRVLLFQSLNHGLQTCKETGFKIRLVICEDQDCRFSFCVRQHRPQPDT